MKVMFVNVVKDIPIQCSLYPLGFGYLVSYCRSQGVDLDCVYAEDLSAFLREKPDVVAFTCITENYSLTVKYASYVKKIKSDVKVLVGGVHFSAVPDSVTEDMDVAVLGEGERTFYELAKNGFDPDKSIAGLYYGGVKNEYRPLIEPLDSIPYADRSIYRLGDRASYIFTSRGCSYSCKFCSSSRFWRKVRLHSPEYVAGEILQLKNSGVKHITIFDDTFLLSLDRVKQICEIVKGYGLTFDCALRANQVTDEVVSVLRRMGVVRVGMGLESNSKRVLDWLDKGNTPVINQRAVDVLRKAKMPFIASFIVGTPVETFSDIKETWTFIKKNHIKYDMYGLMPFPNTPIYSGDRNFDRCVISKFKFNLFGRLVRF